MRILPKVLFVVASFVFATTCYCEVVDRIIAIVNDDIITLREAENFVQVEKKNEFTSVDEYLTNLKLRERLDFFIDALLIKQQAKKLKIDVSDKEVESIVENIKKQNLITEIELKEQLKRENITYENFVEGIRLSVLRSRVLGRVISPEVNITNADLKLYYDRHKEEYVQEEYHLGQIFVSNQRNDASSRAQNAYRLLLQGASFEDMAKQYSDDPSANQGGDIGLVKGGEVLPALRESLKGLAPGKYTNVIQTPYGFHILKLIEIQKGDVPSFETLKDKMHERIVSEESEKRYKDYINKLRQASYIEVKI
ncbi:MAG TPA: peptidylprolyl isomerase [Syntrophorhabdaceae bacterium]|nr:peptidylprolyl isomerase [Syntrophorhabdaceae bacterium]